MASVGIFSQIERENCWGSLPLPDITEILDQLLQSKYFPCLDMVMGYQQI